MAYRNLRFCWHGVVSTDVDRAKAFFTEAIGWKAQTVDMGGEMTMFVANEIPRAHLSAPPMEGVPSHISSYLRVEDVDAAVKAAADNGGAVMVPGTDIPVGRFAVVTSPTGGPLSLFREADESSENAPSDDLGAFHWIECHSTDAATDTAWLEKSFGLQSAPMELPEGQEGPPGGYTLLKDDAGDVMGGIMTQQMPGAPSFWLTWIAIDDCDDCAKRVETHGGQVLSPPVDMKGIGRMAVVQEPTGAVLGIIKPEAAGW